MLPQRAASAAGERGKETACAGGCGQLSSDRHVCRLQKGSCLAKAALGWGRRMDWWSRSIPFCLPPL